MLDGWQSSSRVLLPPSLKVVGAASTGTGLEAGLRSDTWESAVRLGADSPIASATAEERPPKHL